MIPLEVNADYVDMAEERLRNGQVFCTDVFRTESEEKTLKSDRFLMQYHNGKYMAEFIDGNRIADVSLYGALCGLVGQQYKDMLYVLQEWGVSGEQKDGILLAEGYRTVKFDGIDCTLICTAPSAENRKDKISLLQKQCSPSQSFMLVRNLKKADKVYTGENLCETDGLWEAITEFDSTATRSFADTIGGERKSQSELE